MGVGGGLALITDFGDLAIWGRVNYRFAEQWRGNGTFTFHFADNNANVRQPGLDGHYLFLREDALDLYGTGSLNIVNTSVEVLGTRASNSTFGLNLGIGAQFNASSSLQPLAEFKIRLGDGTFIGLFGGVRYRFGQ